MSNPMNEHADNELALHGNEHPAVPIHESGEDYLEQILILETKGGYARSIDIATALNFSKPSVSIAMKTLRERGYITMDEKSHIFLSDTGREIAERIYNRHQKISAFLMTLGVSEKAAREDACKMEHDISEESFQAMCSRLEEAEEAKKVEAVQEEQEV